MNRIQIARHLAWAVPLLLGTTLLRAQVDNVRADRTATQAVITYSAPDSAACLVEVREGTETGPLVPDVDPSLFPGSNLDSRAVNVVTGRRRIFVAGKRAAERGLDGFRHSRALQANTDHSYKITCGGATAAGQFTTMNPPIGMSYNDPLPVDPLNPGQYAWPEFTWTDRNQWVVDPLTGFRMKLLDGPRDAIEPLDGSFASASNVGGATDWVNPSAVLADDTAAATYSASTQGWLFTEFGLPVRFGGTHNSSVSSITSIVPVFNAYCSSGDCATASVDDRSIEFCITTDGATCISDKLTAELKPCTSNCVSATYRFAGITNPQPILADWYSSNAGIPNIEISNLTKRSGTVSRNGPTVTLVNGDPFDLHWTSNAHITINGTVYQIASVDHDRALTLSGSPAGADTNVSYTASNAGILIRKKTPSLQQLSIQSVVFTFETGQAPFTESSGDETSFSNCTPKSVAGPGGEPGFHCTFGGGWYWIGQDSGTVNRLGRTQSDYNGESDGWNHQSCSGGSFWDWNDANSAYCMIQNVQGHRFLFKYTYNGNNTDVGDLLYSTVPTPCNINTSNTPCWSSTNLTPGSLALDLQIAQFHPDWAAAQFHTNTISIFGRMATANSLTLMARRDLNNDTLGFDFKFDLNTKRIVAGISSFAHFPLRWSVLHGPLDLNDPDWIQVSATNFRGPYQGGQERLAGNGPYYNTITTPGGIDNQLHACPVRPANSPIADSDWPTGNKCVTLTVDGEPGDPTPGAYQSGTVSVSGTAVTGTNTFWNSFIDGTQLRIAGNLYNFTFIDSQHGTIDRDAGTIANSAYTIFLETINSPKLGNPNFAYLQDADIRDVFCVTAHVECNLGTYITNEFMRLIYRDPANPNIWTLERGYAGGRPPKTPLAVPESGWLVAVPGTCQFASDSPCGESRGVWNATQDPYGRNASGTTVTRDTGEKGCCHSTRQNGINVAFGGACVNKGESSPGCMFARLSPLPALLTDPGWSININPIFHNAVGIGSPNTVETHPSHTQVAGTAPPSEMRWYADGRPFLGDALLGSSSSPGTLIGGTLYKFTSAQQARYRPRLFPALASCGVNPLLDISGPGSTIATGAADSYKYCNALRADECVGGSTPGDLFVNCPQVRVPYCTGGAVGTSDPEVRNICIADLGALAFNIVQMGVDKPDLDGVYSRRVTTGLGRYQWVNPFWNAKTLPNAKFMVVFMTYLQGIRSNMLLVKLPPFPRTDGIVRNDFIKAKVTIVTPPGLAITNAVVQFGYNKNYFCTSRNEACVQGAAADFAYASENPAGVACASGCTVTVPAISQRVLYYQVLLRDATNNVVDRLSPEVLAIK